MHASPKPTLLVISQVYVPDPASVGQHMADAAVEMARRGRRVVVLTSARGYEDPRQRYPGREIRDGVEIRRMPLASFGKRSIALRVLGAASFLLQVLFRALWMRFDALLVSTSPPICPLAALVISTLRRKPFLYWAMDINPDQAVALGAVAPRALVVRFFNLLNRLVLRRAAKVVTLDHFMAQRLQSKAELGDRLAVIPPWPLEDVGKAIPHSENPFRHEHGLEDKFVVMYSGNMSLAHPLETILQAAQRLRDNHRLMFLFVGGGLGRQAVVQFVEEHRLDNVRILPYQPLERIAYSLSAADVHLVSMGTAMVGVVHPCKIYGAMACARPCLLLGPRDCHAGELIQRGSIGWQIDHGDVDGAVALLERILAADPAELIAMGRRARDLVERELGKSLNCRAFCDLLEEVLLHR